jgi:hypothetical protein
MSNLSDEVFKNTTRPVSPLSVIIVRKDRTTNFVAARAVQADPTHAAKDAQLEPSRHIPYCSVAATASAKTIVGVRGPSRRCEIQSFDPCRHHHGAPELSAAGAPAT